jgi:predicted dehydrogenase
MKNGMNRRSFLGSAAAGAGVLVLKPGMLRAGNSPNEKLNIAIIGVWGRGKDDTGSVKGENIAALCDVNENNLEKAAKQFPDAQKHIDWRKCLDQKGLDAVVCATADHTHAFVTNWALNRNLHVYCEKPLANSVEEARTVRASYLKRKDKVATQVGTQRHASENFNRVREIVLDGGIGELKEAFAWGNRQIRGKDYLPGEGDPPTYLHYDLWIGPSPMHPYNRGYFGGCLQWNKYWDFGSGQVGDMGSHTMDLAWKPLDADLPVSAEGVGEKFNPSIAPVELHTSWDIPANERRPALKLHWYQGGMMPENPNAETDLKKIGHGAMFKGTKGVLVADFGKNWLHPLAGGDLSHYTARPKDRQLPPMGGFHSEWLRACKGEKKTTCNFDYAGKLIETMLLGLVAFRVGRKLKYDGATGKTGDAEADKLMSREYRAGWKLDG